MDKKVKILIVEDEKDTALMMAELFEMWGYSVITAHDGLSALKSASLFLPDVIIIDIGLPSLNGLVLTKTLRNEPAFKSTLFIAVSGFGGQISQRMAKESGIDHY